MVMAVTLWEIAKIVGVVIAMIALVIVVQMRRRSYYRFLGEFAEQEVCPHLKGALELLKSRGHRVLRAGQKTPEMPLEIHLVPPFDPKALAEELKLAPPVYVSERNVLYCKEDGCELKPVE